MRGRIAVACAAVALVAGCSAPEPATSAAPAPVPAGPNAEDTVCQEFTDTGSLARRTAEALEQMPVLPAAIALVLLNTRGIASTPGVENPVLAAAQAELVAAIDDLDAQGKALLGPDGNPAQDTVQLDAARILAAVEEIERVCGGRVA
ncbi:MAG: hypothetical protein H7Y15_12620 [Pseudonocardia sp.]|nr:hypothetical protein [Pseudonocardia sp.]